LKKYLLDTNTCIYYIKGKYNFNQKIEEIGIENCYISIITVAEMQFGISNSLEVNKESNQKALDKFTSGIEILPLTECLHIFGEVKTNLRKVGKIVDDFDLLIGSTAVAHNLILVTRNTKHFERIEGIKLENWIEE
jgi:tRNA(fMet)-specific endonuclease VapC